MSRNDAILAGLRRANSEGRLHHAYLLGGPESPAKATCVEEFAAGLFAEGGGGLFGATEPAAALRRIREGGHPDFTRLQPVDDLIGVDEVRELPRLLAFPPLEAGRRVVLIEGAGKMNTQAANSILKILEEPPAHTMFFLLCRDPGELLPTIVSRTQVLRFAPLGAEELSAALGEGQADPAFVNAWSEGSPERARFLLSQEGGVELGKQAAGFLLDLWEAAPRIPSSVVRWVESLAGEEQCEVVADAWSLFLRDAAFTLSGAQAGALHFTQHFPRLRALVDKHGEALWTELTEKSSVINRYRVYRGFNGNLRLDAAALLVDLQVFSRRS